MHVHSLNTMTTSAHLGRKLIISAQIACCSLLGYAGIATAATASLVSSDQAYNGAEVINQYVFDLVLDDETLETSMEVGRLTEGIYPAGQLLLAEYVPPNNGAPSDTRGTGTR